MNTVLNHGVSASDEGIYLRELSDAWWDAIRCTDNETVLCLCGVSGHTSLNTLTLLTLLWNAKAITSFFITDHVRSGVTSCLSPCWTRKRYFSPHKSPPPPLNWPGIWFWPFPSFPNHFLYRSPPFSYVRSPTIASLIPNPPTHPPKFYFRNLPNWIAYICKGKKTRKGGCLCLCAWEGSCIVFDLIRCVLYVCVTHYTVYIFWVECCVCFWGHRCECVSFRSLCRMFQWISFSFLCLYLPSAGHRDVVVRSWRWRKKKEGIGSGRGQKENKANTV
jgi:hypothetical protein